MDGRMAAAQTRVDAIFIPKRYDGSLFLDAQPSPRKTVLHIPAGRIPFDASAVEITAGSLNTVGTRTSDAPGATQARPSDSTECSKVNGLLLPDLFVGNTEHIGIIGSMERERRRCSTTCGAFSLAKPLKGPRRSPCSISRKSPQRRSVTARLQRCGASPPPIAGASSVAWRNSTPTPLAFWKAP